MNRVELKAGCCCYECTKDSMFLMNRVELKGRVDGYRKSAFRMFLMNRVELKETELTALLQAPKDMVPNEPCGVESLQSFLFVTE